jgi:hypothetical protein
MGEDGFRGTNRRTVLKTIGSSTIALSGISAAASAQGEQLRGIYYDTLTQEVGGTVTGNAEKRDGSLRGTANVAGFSIPLEKLQKTSDSANPRYNGLLTEPRFRNGNQPLKVQFEEHNGRSPHFSGTITHPSGRFGRLGFYLTPDPNHDPAKATAANTPDSRWVNSEHSFSIPNQGIPTDTGSKRLGEILPAPDDPKTGGDR